MKAQNLKHWQIPAKTFLVGEYAAVAHESAIILTTSPCFKLTLQKCVDKDVFETNATGIHPESPAGLFWQQSRYVQQDLLFSDPYNGQGGLGASSAQFLGAYLAEHHLSGTIPSKEDLLAKYDAYTWQGRGLRPSGYDVLAQSQNQCVYINRKKASIERLNWSFNDISFILVHSNEKLATHEHLQTAKLPTNIPRLSALVEDAKTALSQADSKKMLYAINLYHEELRAFNLVASESLAKIAALKEMFAPLAIKGCGALGQDVLLMIVPALARIEVEEQLINRGWKVLADNQTLYKDPPLLPFI